MEFKQLESFVGVIKYQSFTKTAEHLFISQPTVSAHIRMLEEELGSRLIVRTTKNIEITPRGWELYECATHILELRDKLTKRWTKEDKKMIQLGASTIPSSYIIPEILPKFGALFPDVYFNVSQSDSQGILDAMLHGKYDVGMVGKECNSKALECIPFYRDKIVMITPVNEYFLTLKENPQITTELLLENPVILRERGSGSLKTTDYFIESLGLDEEKLDVVARINDQESIKNLVAGGLGLSFISNKAAQNFVNEKRLLCFDLPTAVATRSLYIVYHKEYILKPYITEFINFTKEYYSSRYKQT